MTDVLTKVNQPYLEAAREAVDMIGRLEERMNYGERVARLEARVEQLERLDERLRAVEQRLG